MKENINNILEKISLACKNSNRDKKRNIFVTSSKTVDVDKIQEAID